jgi:exosortase
MSRKRVSENTTPETQDEVIAPERRSWLWLLLLAACFFIAYFPVWESLISTWYSNDDYSHGFLVLPIFFYMTWRNRDDLMTAPIRSTRWGLVLVILALLLYGVGRIGEIQTMASFSMVLVLAAVTLYLYGWHFFKLMAYPLFILLFMIPVPSQIYSTLTIPLQLFVSKISTTIAISLSIPVLREGNVLYLPGQTLEVVQACSGLRSMMSLVMLSAVFGYFTLTSNALRSILFLFSVPAAIIVNIVRVSIMIFAFYFLDYDLTTGTAHTLFGLFIFLLALALVVAMKGALSIWQR